LTDKPTTKAQTVEQVRKVKGSSSGCAMVDEIFFFKNVSKNLDIQSKKTVSQKPIGELLNPVEFLMSAPLLSVKNKPIIQLTKTEVEETKTALKEEGKSDKSVSELKYEFSSGVHFADNFVDEVGMAEADVAKAQEELSMEESFDIGVYHPHLEENIKPLTSQVEEHEKGSFVDKDILVLDEARPVLFKTKEDIEEAIKSNENEKKEIKDIADEKEKKAEAFRNLKRRAYLLKLRERHNDTIKEFTTHYNKKIELAIDNKKYLEKHLDGILKSIDDESERIHLSQPYKEDKGKFTSQFTAKELKIISNLEKIMTPETTTLTKLSEVDEIENLLKKIDSIQKKALTENKRKFLKANHIKNEQERRRAIAELVKERILLLSRDIDMNDKQYPIEINQLKESIKEKIDSKSTGEAKKAEPKNDFQELLFNSMNEANKSGLNDSSADKSFYSVAGDSRANSPTPTVADTVALSSEVILVASNGRLDLPDDIRQAIFKEGESLKLKNFLEEKYEPAFRFMETIPVISNDYNPNDANKFINLAKIKTFVVKKDEIELPIGEKQIYSAMANVVLTYKERKSADLIESYGALYKWITMKKLLNYFTGDENKARTAFSDIFDIDESYVNKDVSIRAAQLKNELELDNAEAIAKDIKKKFDNIDFDELLEGDILFLDGVEELVTTVNPAKEASVLETMQELGIGKSFITSIRTKGAKKTNPRKFEYNLESIADFIQKKKIEVPKTGSDEDKINELKKRIINAYDGK